MDVGERAAVDRMLIDFVDLLEEADEPGFLGSPEVGFARRLH